MGSSHPTHRHHSTDPTTTAADEAQDQAIAFLTDRLREDLARIWARDRPSMAAQVAVVDELLSRLTSRRLPPVHQLRMLLFGYGDHPAYDPGWTDLLLRQASGF
jgi:hypothetical protein